jgi:hypothetical protein
VSSEVVFGSGGVSAVLSTAVATAEGVDPAVVVVVDCEGGWLVDETPVLVLSADSSEVGSAGDWLSQPMRKISKK